MTDNEQMEQWIAEMDREWQDRAADDMWVCRVDWPLLGDYTVHPAVGGVLPASVIVFARRGPRATMVLEFDGWPLWWWWDSGDGRFYLFAMIDAGEAERRARSVAYMVNWDD